MVIYDRQKRINKMVLSMVDNMLNKVIKDIEYERDKNVERRKRRRPKPTQKTQ